jgi:hypothetical protein
MPDAYDTAPLQPRAIFFDLSLGPLSKIYVGPQIPVDFTLKLGGAPEVTFTLFSEDGSVEAAIYQSRDPQTKVPGGTFQFGYLNGKKSPNYTFQIASYHPTFVGNAFMITIVGTTLMSPLISSNTYTGTLKEVLDQFCKNHNNMTLNIDPPFGTEHMTSVGYTDVDSTAPSEMVHTSAINDSDISFLKRILPYARDVNGGGGYNWHISDDGQGQSTLSITKAKNGSANFKYIVQDKNSVVRSWSPSINFDGIIKNQNDAQQNATQRFSGYENTTCANQAVTDSLQEKFELPYSNDVKASPVSEDPTQLQYQGTANAPPAITNATSRTRGGASTDSGAGINPFLNSHLWEWMSSYEATLEIDGDPDVVPTLTQGSTALCDVTCYWPTNYKQKQSKQLHYTSGLYQIVDVVHHISAGNYSTTLSLSRAASNIPEGAEDS